jgi:hypothetical protein
MSLRDRPDFQSWLARFEERHAHLHPDEPREQAAICDGCGDPIEAPVSSTGYCLVCLAETYGRERGQAAGRVAGMFEAALGRSGDTPSADVRDAIEEVLERYEREGDEDDG